MAFKAVTALELQDTQRGLSIQLDEKSGDVELYIASDRDNQHLVLLFQARFLENDRRLFDFFRSRFYLIKNFFAHPGNQCRANEVEYKLDGFKIRGSWYRDKCYVHIFQKPSQIAHSNQQFSACFTSNRFTEVLEAVDKAMRLAEKHFLLKNPK